MRPARPPALWLALALALFVAIGRQAPKAQSGGYTLVPLTGAGPASDVNDNGVVVGQWDGPGGSRGYTWTLAGGLQPITTAPAIVSRFPCSPPRLNASGTIAASASHDIGCGVGPHRAAAFNPASGLAILSDQQGDDGQTANAINARGDVVGRFQGNSQHPYIWFPGGGLDFMDVFGIAWDVNDLGVAAGYCAAVTGCNDVAFIWTQAGGAQALPRVAGWPDAFHEALAINNAGVVVGRYLDGASNQQGIFQWSAASGTVDLGVPVTGAGPTTEMDINDAGDIVASFSGPIPTAVIYRNGAWSDLNELAPGNSFRMKEVTAINNHGWIVGSGGVGTDTGIGVVLVPPTPNTAPVAANAPVTTAEDTPVAGLLSATDADGDSLTYSIVAHGALGIVSITNPATGEYTYTPAANAFGTDTFTFKANDGTADSNVATVTVTITPVPDAPTAVASSYPGIEDTPFGSTLQAADPDGDSLTFAIDAPPTKGTGTITNPATGAFSYVPHSNANGADTFTFTASDGTLTSLPALFTIDIAPVNDPPIAQAGVVTTTEGASVTGQVTATDVDGDALTFSAIQPAGGVVTMSPNGAFTYTPNAGTVGYDPFVFVVSDGQATGSSTESVFVVADSPRWPGQTVRANVTSAGAQSPTFGTCSSTSADGRFIAFGSAAALVPGDTNAQSDIFVRDRQTGSTSRVSVSSAGVQANGPSQCPILSADGRYVGFESQASNLVSGDTNGGYDLFRHDRVTGQTIRVNVASGGVQTAALAQVGGIMSMSADGRMVAFMSSASTLVGGDTNAAHDVFVHDVEASTTTRVSVTSTAGEADGQSQYPTMSADGRFVAFVSSATNLVPGDTNNTSDVFVRDLSTNLIRRVSVSSTGAQGDGGSQQAHLSQTGRFVVFRSFATNFVPGGSGQLFLHDQLDGSTVVVSKSASGALGNGSHGGATRGASISADGRFVAFISTSTNLVAGDTNGVEDVFVRDRAAETTTRVSVSDAGVQAAGASFGVVMSADGRFITVESAAANLVAGDTNSALDVFSIGGVRVTPLAQTVAASGGSGTADVSFVYPGTSWSATSQTPWITITGQSAPDGNGTVTFDLAPNPVATRTGTLTLALQTVTITQEGSTVPIASDGALATSEDTPAAGSLVATDPNSDPLTFSLVANGTLGTAAITNAATGAFTYTPNANANGVDIFTFRASDGTAHSNVATVTVTIAAVNDAPVALDGALEVTEDTAASGTLMASDVDGTTLTFALASSPAKGVAVITDTATGAYTYMPNVDATGTDTFTFTVSDGVAGSNTATVSVTIGDVNDVPVAGDAAFTVTEDVPFSGTLSGADPDGGTLTFLRITGASKGRVVIVDPSNGGFTYTPHRNATGSDTFTFAVSDGTATSSVATVAIAISAENDAPVALGRSLRVVEDEPLGVKLSGNDVDGDAITFTVVDPPDHGTLSGTPPMLVYTPAQDFNGSDSFTFRASDGTATSVVASVALTITPSVWSPLGPEGGVGSFAISASNPRVLYAGGASAYRSDDGGATWQRVGEFPDPASNQLVVDPAVPTTVYAPVADGILKSTDGGATWTTHNSGFELPLSNGTRTLAMDPVTPGTLYAVAGERLYKSTDGALNWSLSETGLPGFNDPVQRLAIDPVTSTTLYAATSSAVYKSIDGGATWAGTGGGLSGSGIQRLAIDPDQPSTVYAAILGTGVFKTTNGGTNWTPAGAGISDTNFRGLVVDPSAPSVVYAATMSGVFKTIDGGSNWSATNTGLPALSSGIFQLNIDPLSSGTLYVSTQQGPYKTINGGASWTASASGLMIGGPDVIVSDRRVPETLYTTGRQAIGVLKSVDQGQSWTPTGLLGGGQPVSAIAADLATAGTIYAATPTAGIFKTVNDGASWTAINSGLTTLNVATIVIDGSTPATLYAGTPFGGVFKSTTAGGNWTPVNTGLTQLQVRGLAIDPTTSPATLYVATNTVSKSTDGGSNWSAASTGLSGFVTVLATDPSAPGVVYAGSSNGVFKSTNGGGTWSAANNGIPALDRNISALLVDPATPNHVYAGTLFEGQVYESRDGGSSWQVLGPGLPGTSVRSLDVGAGTPRRLYAAAFGVFAHRASANDSPSAFDQTLSTPEGTPLQVTLTAADPDGDNLSYSLGSASHGQLSGTPPSVTYTPAAQFAGPDSFQFTVTDGTSISNVATVSIEVTAENTPPVALDGSLAVTEDTPASGTLTSTDEDGPSATFSIVTNGTKGVATVTNAATGAFTYVPNADANGPDAFTFQVSDGLVTSGVATITVTIAAVGDVTLSHTAMDFGSQAVNTISAALQSSVGAASMGLGTGDLDGDGDLDVVVADTFDNGVTVGLNDGRGRFSALPRVGVGDHPNGQIVVRDFDGDGDLDVAVANQHSGSVSVLLNQGGGVLGPATGIPGYPQAVSLASGDVNGDGRLDLVVGNSAARPPLLGNGDGTFTPGLENLPALPCCGLALVDVNADGRLDLVNNRLLHLGNGDGSFSAPVSTGLAPATWFSEAGDFNGDGRVDLAGVERSTVALPTQVVHGNGDGTFQAPLSFAHDTYSWALGTGDLDGDDRSDVVAVTDVSGTLSVYRGATTGGLTSHVRYGHFTASAPPAVADFDGDGASDVLISGVRLLRGKGDGTLVASQMAVLVNRGGSAISVGPLTVLGPDATSFSANQNCVQTVGPESPCPIIVDFRPMSSGPKTATLEITTSDGPLTIALSGNGVNTAPVAAPDSYGATEDTVLTVPAPGVRGNDTDVNGDPLTVALVSTPAHGTVTLDAGGGFIYTPAPDFNGSDSFTYTASDGTATSNVATVSITVDAVNDRPVATAGTLAATAGTPANGTLTATDIDSTTLTFSIASNGSQGVATIVDAASGAYTYLANPTATGTDSFSFIASDGTASSDAATITVSIDSAAPTVIVQSPNGGERLFINRPATLRWNTTNATSIDVAVSRDGGTTFVPIAACTGLPGAATSCPWTPTAPASTTALIRVIAQGAGAATTTDTSDAVFVITSGTPTITVTAPNAAVSWAAGSQRTITWNHNLGTSTFRIELTRDAGVSWEVLAASVANATSSTGSWPWVPLEPLTQAARVRVTQIDGPATDQSNNPLAIAAPLLTLTAPNTNVAWGIDSAATLRWSHNLGTAESVTLELSADDGTTWQPVAAAAPNQADATGSYTWTVTGPATTTARIRVGWAGHPLVLDASDVSFRIVPRVTVTSPNTALTWAAGSTRTITWSHSYGAAQLFDLAFSPDGGATWTPLASGVAAATATTGSHEVDMPAVTTTQALIRVGPAGRPEAADVSNVPFALVPAAISVTAPNTAVAWTLGSNRTIRWTHNLGRLGQVLVELSRDGGATWEPVATGANSAETSGTVDWTVTGPVSDAARIRVRWTEDATVQDVSDVNFRITSRITVTSPNSALVWGAGSTRTVTWNHDYGTAQLFDLAFSPDGGVTWTPLASGVGAATATTGTYSGAMPTVVTSQALIRVSPAGAPGDGDVSNTVFRLDPAAVTVTAPNTNVSWTVGSSRTIRWDHNLGQAAQMAVELSRDGGTTWEAITTVANTGNVSGAATWITTGPPTTTARIRVSWTGNATVFDVSDVNFQLR